MTESTKKPQGFATLSPEQLHAICSKGGKAAHEKGTAHQFDPREAKEAGRKGGATVSADRAHMAEIGRKGGKARGEKARAAARAFQARASNARLEEQKKAFADGDLFAFQKPAILVVDPAIADESPAGEEPLY